jgi:hypothetical protein
MISLTNFQYSKVLQEIRIFLEMVYQGWKIEKNHSKFFIITQVLSQLLVKDLKPFRFFPPNKNAFFLGKNFLH